ncbi:thiolase family protein [Roseovarius amoyensis]|uniref:thiolase family protein n=1 Tax=Roseovarius amoyensis TaxID=2211448 RepID=UPI0013A693B0|nr:thiolase family protein [Roseovarius amoyensis]
MVCIVGIGETPCVRKSAHDIGAMTLKACIDAITDAGLKPQDIDGLICDSGMMPFLVPQDWIAAQLGIELSYGASISFGGAATASAPLLAESALKSGRATCILYYFGIDWGSRVGGPYAFHDLYPAKSVFEKPHGFNAQPTYFGMWAQRYMQEFSGAQEAFAEIATTARRHAELTGRAQKSRPMSVANYYDSRMIADPLRAADCCLISDGAGAYVMTDDTRARDCAHPVVSVAGSGFASAPISGDDVFTQPGRLLHTPAAPRSTAVALREAGLSLDDIDFAEIYDCSTVSCLLQIEDIGFCKKGEGPDFIRERGISVEGGGLPINTHGGLLSYSYRLGIEHMLEAVRQLRGDCGANQVAEARIGLVGGFSPPDYGVSILKAGV